MNEILDMTRNEEICYNTLFQWKCKALEIYGDEKVKGFFEYFRISLSEIYYISFEKPFEVKIEIGMDLKDMAKRLFFDKIAQNEWIKNEIESIINMLKINLNKILTIIRRSKRTNTISVFFKSWTEEIPAIIIFSKQNKIGSEIF